MGTSPSGLIPNPFDKDSSLADLAIRGERGKEVVGFGGIAKNIAVLVILGFLLVTLYKLPLIAAILLVGVEIVINIISAYIRLNKIKALNKISDIGDGNRYLELLIRSEQYEIIKALFGIVANAVSLVLVLHLFFPAILSGFQGTLSRISLDSATLHNLLFIFVTFRVFEFVTKLARYYLIKHIVPNNNLALVQQQYIILEKKLKLVNSIPPAGIIFLFIFLLGVPLWIVLAFLCIYLIIAALSVIELWRISKIKLDNTSISKVKASKGIEYYQGERIVYALFGIMRTATSLKSMFQPMGTSFLGSGTNHYPENTLLLTDRRILLIQVPVTGGDRIVGQTDYVTKNFFFNRSEMRKKGEEIIKTLPMNEMLKLAVREFRYDQIRSLRLKNTQLIIEETSGKRSGYLFMEKEYLDPLREHLKSILGSRLIEQ
ncbi:MAG: hypothetical protein ABIA93_01290 [Candidatus Woesearchaeota archaeon]